MKLIGDPHLGREFKRNVPLDRRGEREEMMFAKFIEEINDPNNREALIVIVGDLFEHWHIDYKYLHRTIEILQNWKPRFPFQRIIIMQGNHDYSPSPDVKGAFDILEQTFRGSDKIFIVRKVTTLFGIMFFPWQWDRSALEQLDDVTLWTNTAVGHWDLADYGGDTGHLCPAEKLAEKGVQSIFSGHWHLAGVYSVGGIDVTCTGSMQPMTHAEDPDGKLYVTLSAEDYRKASEADLHGKYVRVLVKAGDTVDPPPSCLGFQVQRATEEQQKVERVTLGEFDIDKILDKHLKQKAVPEPVAKEIKGNLSGIA